MTQGVYIHEFAVACALGADAEAVSRNLLSPMPPTVRGSMDLGDGRTAPAGILPFELTDESSDSRCNRLADHCLTSLGPAIGARSHPWDRNASRSLSGLPPAACVRRRGFRVFVKNGNWPGRFAPRRRSWATPRRMSPQRIGAVGPAYGISTACTSGAKALASAARLLAAGLCDVAIAGGIDSLCDLTLNGFSALESLSDAVCNPFSANRRGINLGEGGALFLLSRTRRPSGSPAGARVRTRITSARRIRKAKARRPRCCRRCARGMRRQCDIGYLNLHGTATKLNDLMEARAVSRVFGADLPCSSTKPMTGHMLGAAGACEAAFTLDGAAGRQVARPSLGRRARSRNPPVSTGGAGREKPIARGGR